MSQDPRKPMYFSPTFWQDKKTWEALAPDRDREIRAAFRNKQTHLLRAKT